MSGIVAWAQPQQAELLRGIIDDGSVTLEAVAAPCPDRTRELAGSLEVPPATDLRRELHATAPPEVTGKLVRVVRAVEPLLGDAG